ncbi:ubiquitin-conjugating enzyme E2 S-like protein [Neocallimastix lanati (nom. inval.)]|uniref:E2 ubiquitin-conjugating enzyme n=1 Tax=Neocallimastix californiae TaxID=1754190 RepID=A0A1Y2F6Y4_9FUNG|nr:ubiquitin-conjugating enzyme E2 S-like protein [Neocallimastix sp. JGI-2020a]ORY79631.1 ubiquitin-conjugating enzyme E2 S-like protein [Neocallimastix californiae]|eukprot:ORY79631.1 ubiquitin-conjugating enzyme E2 S-like protein [Neocallimastix californiae]
MKSIENLSPAVVKRIVKEVTALTQKPPEGICMIEKEENICDIQAIIKGPEGTPYEGGAFQIKLVLGSDFPISPPKGYFLTKIFHPNVSNSGEICVNTLKKDWKKELGIEHILLTIKCLLIVPNPESALNEEAGKLLLEDYDEYARHARLFTKVHAISTLQKYKLLKKEKEDPSSSKDNDTISHTKHTKTKYDAQLNVNKKRVADKKIQKGNDKKRSLRRL